jgi:hypothetical protein
MADKITTIITPYLLRSRLPTPQSWKPTKEYPAYARPAKDLRPLQFIPNHTFHPSPFPVSLPFGPVPYYLRASIGVAVSIAWLPL